MKGTTYKRCNCRDPETGKYYNQKCPQLSSRRHGSWMFDVRIDITSRDGHRLKRAGYDTQTDAKSALDHVNDLIKLAKDDGKLRRRIGDLIVEKSKRGGELPTVEDVRRKLGAGIEIDAPSMTLAAWLEDWLAGKRTLKASARLAYRKHMDHWLIPHLGEIPLDKLRAEHIGGLFDLIEEFNAEIVQARKEKRKPRLPGDTRKVKKITGPATQHRIFATLRNALNVAVKRRHIDYNPCMSVELPPEKRPPARVWSPEQVVTFLEKTADDRLGLLYRIILLRGLRRGEACGLRNEDVLPEGEGNPYLRVEQEILQLHGKLHFDTPKTKAGERIVALDSETVKLIPAHRDRQRRERLANAEVYQDHGLFFCREDGTPLSPDWVSQYFKILARRAGLPPIKLHEARHTAATLMLEAGVDIKIVSDGHGHSTTRITQDLYQHVRLAVHQDAAEKVLQLLPADSDQESDQETGS